MTPGPFEEVSGICTQGVFRVVKDLGASISQVTKQGPIGTAGNSETSTSFSVCSGLGFRVESLGSRG